METNVWFATLFTSLPLFYLCRRLWEKTSNGERVEWPPGPAKLPLLGNLHQLAKGGSQLHHTLVKLANVHGRMMTVWVGSWRPMIVVSDAELAWEVLVNKSSDYGDRNMPSVSGLLTADMHTVATADTGSHWHTLRRGLQNGPLGPVNLSAQIKHQEGDMKLMINSIVEEAQKNNGVVKPLGHIRRATIRLLSRICFGADFSDDAFVDGMDKVLEEAINVTGHTRLADAFALARFIPFLNRTFVEAKAAKRSIEELLRPMLSRPAPPNSYLQVLLSKYQPDDVSIMALFEVFLLGLDSTASTATWALAFLVHHQDMQERLYQEVDGYAKDQLLRAEDVAKLPYLQAVTKEAMRMKPIAPLAVPHKTARDTTLWGRRVAKGTQVVVNIYAVHYDPKTWPEPHQFKPERFLVEGKGSGGGEIQSFLPFGGGMRACAGMELGKMQVAMVVANLVKALKWLPEAEGKLPDLTEDMTFVLMIKTPLEARIVPRVKDRAVAASEV